MVDNQVFGDENQNNNSIDEKENKANDVEVTQTDNFFVKVWSKIKGAFSKCVSFISNKVENVKKDPVSSYMVKGTFNKILAALICGAAGLVLGFLFMFFVNPANFGLGLAGFFDAGFSTFTKVIYYMTQLILCALAVGFCYKCGMFNIGVPGVYMLGGFVALMCGYLGHMPWIFSLLFGVLVGAIYGAIPGILKAFFNVNEVISAIMLNWVAFFLIKSMIYGVNGLYDAQNADTYSVNDSQLSYTVLPTFTSDTYINLGFIFAILVAISLKFVLDFTSFGYKIKAVGLNKDASTYAGINSRLMIILAFVIGGACAGLSGALKYLLPNTSFLPTMSEVASEGFDGIPIAFLAYNDPIGIVFSALFISFLKVAGSGLTSADGYDPKFADLTISIIFYFAGFAALIYELLMKDRKKKDNNLVENNNVVSIPLNATEDKESVKK